VTTSNSSASRPAKVGKIAVRVIFYAVLFGAGFIVIPFVITVIVPQFQIERYFSVSNQSRNHLSQIGIAMHDYVQDHGVFPPAVVYRQGQPLYSWRVLLLPYLEEQTLYSQFKLDEPWDSPNNEPLLVRMPDVYGLSLHRDAQEPYATHYQVFAGGGAIFGASPQARLLSLKDISAADGCSKTLLVVEAIEPVLWTKPEDLHYAPDQPLPRLGGSYPGNFKVLMADGSVRSFSKEIDENIIRAMITWNGGEQVKMSE
jgi:hypothetical protein